MYCHLSLGSHCVPLRNITISFFRRRNLKHQRSNRLHQVAHLVRGSATWSQTQVSWLQGPGLRPLPWTTPDSLFPRLMWGKGSKHSPFLTAVGLCPSGRGGSTQMGLTGCLVLSRCSWLAAGMNECIWQSWEKPREFGPSGGQYPSQITVQYSAKTRRRPAIKTCHSSFFLFFFFFNCKEQLVCFFLV